MEKEKLKTLKEIEKNFVGNPSEWNNYADKDLRAEAVKLRKLDKEGFKKYLDVNYIDLNAMFILTLFIEIFFNLTEDDLK